MYCKYSEYQESVSELPSAVGQRAGMVAARTHPPGCLQDASSFGPHTLSMAPASQGGFYDGWALEEVSCWCRREPSLGCQWPWVGSDRQDSGSQSPAIFCTLKSLYPAPGFEDTKPKEHPLLSLSACL